MPIAESKVREILAHPLDYDGWTIQGLGMLRLYLGSDRCERLHIWDPDMALNSAVSAHDHPWDFSSRVYFGFMDNQRYTISDTSGHLAVRTSSVLCGVGGCLRGKPVDRWMSEAGNRETYRPGEGYAMEASEFHDSFPTAGTVTVIERDLRVVRDEATICWAGGGDWVQEEFTRNATRDEILHFAGLISLK